jgi:delta
MHVSVEICRKKQFLRCWFDDVNYLRFFSLSVSPINRCKSGYKGPNCDECEVYPGCMHGTCTTKWECKCKEGWGGLFCNQDLNFCTNHRPCHNGGTCSNTGEGSYTCKCPPGFVGKDCEIKVKDCSINPCLHNGTCSEDKGGYNDGYTCQCQSGWIGKHCEKQTVACASKPCLHGGSCRDSSLGFKCTCAPGYGGLKCELQVQNCNPNPCLNGGKCSAIRGDRYQCQCPKGFEGANCEENIDDCLGNPCKNGGNCIDGINQYQCKCTAGYTGAVCEKRVDFCLAKPCANGGNCINKNNGFNCSCRSGFTGIDCSIDIDECQSAPCRNGATCFNRINSYECHCSDGYQGVNCDEPLNRLHQASTSSYQEAQIRSRSDNLDSVQWALIVVTSVAVPFIAICGIAVAICMKRKRKREQEKDDAEARKQNEQNASHITHLHQHHHNSIVAVKRSSNSNMALDNSTHHMIKNTWDKSINNMTNSISMDDGCMLNTSMYGTMSNYSDNVSGANTSQSDVYQSQIVPDSLARAKSQKQLNTDPAVVNQHSTNRASLIMHRHPPAKELALDKRISVLAEAASWSGNNHTTSRLLLDRCSPPHI